MKINISAAARAALISVLTPTQIRTADDRAVELDDGTFDSEIPDDLYEEVEEQMLPGETLSDAILRLVAVHRGEIS